MFKFLRKYYIHFIIAVISIAVFVMLFSLFAADVSDSCSIIYRTSTTENNEILFSTSDENSGESFYNLNGSCYAFSKEGKRIVADIFMDMPNIEYGDNSLLYTGNIGENCCAVSADVMNSLGISLGDEIIAGDISFKVTLKLMAQKGADDDFGHSGVIVLSFNEQLLKGVSSFSYLTFLKDGDGYVGLKNLVYTRDLSAEAINTLISSFAIQFIVWIILIIVCEIFLFRWRKKDYDILYADGVPQIKLFRTIFLEMCIKYLFPLIFVSVVYFGVLSYYGILYLLPILCYLVVMLIICAVMSLIFLKGVK